MAKPDNSISVHRCFFEIQSRKIKEVINEISKKDSLSAEDTQAIRELTEVYDSLTNPVPENYVHDQADYNNGHDEESQ